jgi:hypothetical protein
VGYFVDDKQCRVKDDEYLLFNDQDVQSSDKNTFNLAINQNNRQYFDSQCLYRATRTGLEFMCRVTPREDLKFANDPEFSVFLHPDGKEWAIARVEERTFTIFKSDITDMKYVMIEKEFSSASEAQAFIFNKKNEKDKKGYQQQAAPMHFSIDNNMFV